MKKGTLSQVMLSLLLILFLSNCTKSALDNNLMTHSNLKSDTKNIERKFNILNKTYIVPDDSTFWQVQLSKIIENNNWLERNNLQLISYEYLKDINSVEELTALKNSIGNLFPSYVDQNNFKIQEAPKFKNEFRPYLDTIISSTKSAISKKLSKHREVSYFKQGDLGAVRLKWSYNGNMIYTTCIVSREKGIIYDNFLYFICYKNTNVKRLGGIPSLLKMSEGGDIPDGGSPVSFTDDEGGMWENLFGMTVFECYIHVEVTGKAVVGAHSIQTKAITGHTYNANYNSAIGFSGEARVESISFKTGTNGHFQYAWGYCFKFAGSATLGWDGVSFSVPTGASEGHAGGSYVGPDALH